MSTPQAKLRLYTAEEYLAMERASEEKHEYLDGVIYDMAGETTSHGRISVNLIVEFGAQLKGTQCELFAKDTKVRSGPDPQPIWPPKDLFSYPDIVVLCGKGEYHDHYQDVLLNPKVIIEVLSAGTAKYDLTEKFRRYRAYLPSLTDYILVSQTTPAIDHFRKQADGDWLLSTLEGPDATLRIESIGCAVKLSEIYARVEFETSRSETAEEAISTNDPDQQ